jgi:hypothetical protein
MRLFGEGNLAKDAVWRPRASRHSTETVDPTRANCQAPGHSGGWFELAGVITAVPNARKTSVGCRVCLPTLEVHLCPALSCSYAATPPARHPIDQAVIGLVTVYSVRRNATCGSVTQTRASDQGSARARRAGWTATLISTDGPTEHETKEELRL